MRSKPISDRRRERHPATVATREPAARLISVCRARNATIATAESCTGGLIGGALTAIPGSSAVFRGGIIAYADEVKQRLLGVPQATLARHGAVSAETVKAMALGALKRTGAEYAVAVSGIAGPGGGTREKPVGLVFIAAAGKSRVTVSRHLFTGSRHSVRLQTVRAALSLLLRTTHITRTR